MLNELETYFQHKLGIVIKYLKTKHQIFYEGKMFDLLHSFLTHIDLLELYDEALEHIPSTAKTKEKSRYAALETAVLKISDIIEQIPLKEIYSPRYKESRYAVTEPVTISIDGREIFIPKKAHVAILRNFNNESVGLVIASVKKKLIYAYDSHLFFKPMFFRDDVRLKLTGNDKLTQDIIFKTAKQKSYILNRHLDFIKYYSLYKGKPFRFANTPKQFLKIALEHKELLALNHSVSTTTIYDYLEDRIKKGTSAEKERYYKIINYAYKIAHPDYKVRLLELLGYAEEGIGSFYPTKNVGLLTILDEDKSSMVRIVTTLVESIYYKEKKNHKLYLYKRTEDGNKGDRVCVVWFRNIIHASEIVLNDMLEDIIAQEIIARARKTRLLKDKVRLKKTLEYALLRMFLQTPSSLFFKNEDCFVFKGKTRTLRFYKDKKFTIENITCKDSTFNINNADFFDRHYDDGLLFPLRRALTRAFPFHAGNNLVAAELFFYLMHLPLYAMLDIPFWYELKTKGTQLGTFFYRLLKYMPFVTLQQTKIEALLRLSPNKIFYTDSAFVHTSTILYNSDLLKNENLIKALGQAQKVSTLHLLSTATDIDDLISKLNLLRAKRTRGFDRYIT